MIILILTYLLFVYLSIKCFNFIIGEFLTLGFSMSLRNFSTNNI
jgi:hypothetical protein